MAREKGLDEAKSVRMGSAERITFFFKIDSAKSYPPQFVKANTNGKLRIITQTKDRFYVLYQPKPGVEEKEISYGSVYDIPMTDVFLTLVEIPPFLFTNIVKVDEWLIKGEKKFLGRKLEDNTFETCFGNIIKIEKDDKIVEADDTSQRITTKTPKLPMARK